MAATNLLCLLMTFLAFVLHEQDVLGENVYVVVGPELAYHPDRLQINVGDTVVWKWAYPMVPGTVPHTVTKSLSFDRKCEYIDDAEKAARGVDFHSGFQLSGHEFNVTFLKPELVTYHCETTGRTCINCNLGMWAQIEVVESGAQTERIDLSKYKLKPDLATSIVLNKDVNNLATDIGSAFLNVFG